MDWSHLSCMACGAIGVWLALTSGKRRCEIESDEPIRLADGWWFPKAKNPPPRPPAPPSITEGRSRGNMSFTWTTHRFVTQAGAEVVVRWCGESNGYYSESVYFERTHKRIPEPPEVT